MVSSTTAAGKARAADSMWGEGCGYSAVCESACVGLLDDDDAGMGWNNGGE